MSNYVELNQYRGNRTVHIHIKELYSEKSFLNMPNITIDGKDYDLDSLSDSAKEQLGSLQFVQNEIKKLEGQLAICKTASIAYSNALKNSLDN